MPDMKRFNSTEGYYSTLFHELIHWTGSEKRLDRFKKDESTLFGSESYSKEELVAELGAAFISAEIGIDNSDTLKNTAAYIQNWIKRLKSDATLIFSAASKAKKAISWMKSETEESEESVEATEPELVGV
jgi:antirestriction protein ArdC